MKHLNLLLVAGLMTLIGSALAWSAEDELYPNIQWTELFNGQDLTGWTQANGTAKYEAKDGAIVGSTVVKSPNSFLKSARMYGNFVLEYEFKVDETMNSGVQVRSHNFETHSANRVHGYQIEIDPSKRAWSAGLYDEARRGWLMDLKAKPAAGAAFKHKDWNKVRIAFVGDHIQTWINGVAATDLHDSLTPAGFIYLQVHSIGNDAKKAGEQVAWRNLRIKDLDRVERVRGPEGLWKGSTSEFSKGIYAKVEKAGDDIVARLYGTPELTGAPLAELKGKTEERTTTLAGGDWSGKIERGLFTGKGKAKQVKLVKVEGQSASKAEETDKVVDVTFEMMKGAAAPAM